MKLPNQKIEKGYLDQENNICRNNMSDGLSLTTSKRYTLVHFTYSLLRFLKFIKHSLDMTNQRSAEAHMREMWFSLTDYM
jgi:hypothetical protein